MIKIVKIDLKNVNLNHNDNEGINSDNNDNFANGLYAFASLICSYRNRGSAIKIPCILQVLGYHINHIKLLTMFTALCLICVHLNWFKTIYLIVT